MISRLPKDLKVLVACEESQAICKAFLARGFDAYSCDLKPCSGGLPERHFQQDCFQVLKENRFDLVIAHPPCTYLCCAQNSWMNRPDLFPDRLDKQKEAIEFFMRFVHLPVRFLAIENPVGCMSTMYRKPDQIIQPWYFGDSASKKTCLWLRNLPLLHPTEIVSPGKFIVTKSGKKMPYWYYSPFAMNLPKEERASFRSKTFPGVANAIAEQWGDYLLRCSLSPPVYIQVSLF